MIAACSRVGATLLLGAALGSGLVARAAHGAGALTVDGRHPTRAVVTLTADRPPTGPPPGDMARAVAGVLVELDSADDVKSLTRCERRVALTREPPGAAACYIHLFDEDRHRVLQVTRGSEHFLLFEVDSLMMVGALDIVGLERLRARGPRFQRCLDAVDDPVGQRFVMAPPYLPAPIELDRSTLKRRLYRDINVVELATDRVLDRAVMRARLSASYDPRRPAGLLVWASPSPSGEIPGMFDDVLDDLDLAAVGVDDTGNDRDVPDKLQLMLDAVATCMRRYHIDERRVYIAGHSGGGKLGSILAICFPDVFTGAVPIAGVATHGALGPDWGQHQQAYFSRPRGRMLDLARDRAIAPISGPLDFNYLEMKERAQLLQADGFRRVRFFEDRNMGHTMPPPALFRAAVEFVDAPVREQRARESEAAESLLQAYLGDRGETAPRTASDRRQLIEITEAGPFTPAAWRACELLEGTDSSAP